MAEYNVELERLNRRTDRRIFHYVASITAAAAAFGWWLLSRM
jgi:hypothetical protein